MKMVIVLCLVALCHAQQRYAGAGDSQILRYDNDYGYPNFKWGYETSNNIKNEQQGEIRNQGREDELLALKGKFSWVGPDGVTYTVTYTADENGFQPEVEQGPGGAIPSEVAASLIG